MEASRNLIFFQKIQIFELIEFCKLIDFFLILLNILELAQGEPRKLCIFLIFVFKFLEASRIFFKKNTNINIIIS